MNLSRVTKRELFDALRAILPYAENEAEALAELQDCDVAIEEAERASKACEAAQKLIDEIRRT